MKCIIILFHVSNDCKCIVGFGCGSSLHPFFAFCIQTAFSTTQHPHLVSQVKVHSAADAQACARAANMEKAAHKTKYQKQARNLSNNFKSETTRSLFGTENFLEHISNFGYYVSTDISLSFQYSKFEINSVLALRGFLQAMKTLTM